MHRYAALLALSFAAGATLHAQNFNVRPGTWQFNMTMQGAIPLTGVPAETRAQFEAEMRKPRTFTSCVAAEDIKQLNLGKMDDGSDEDCKVLTSKITPTIGDITRQCTGDDAFTETAHFEAPTPQSMRANISRKSATGTMTIVTTGKWLAALCKD